MKSTKYFKSINFVEKISNSILNTVYYRFSRIDVSVLIIVTCHSGNKQSQRAFLITLRPAPLPALSISVTCSTRTPGPGMGESTFLSPAYLINSPINFTYVTLTAILTALLELQGLVICYPLEGCWLKSQLSSMLAAEWACKQEEFINRSLPYSNSPVTSNHLWGGHANSTSQKTSPSYSISNRLITYPTRECASRFHQPLRQAGSSGINPSASKLSAWPTSIHPLKPV